ncbi:hypothetical protein [Dyadobacter sp. MSC1_007]|jgi:hypothetical protein|uniref:hypothetical protein n=1 Tax=Dyadobacter sp. MSC1_007 TaxID=2909264 RepID=UPI002030C4B4|nr:hypothetical protein [Dyadobacter sp. MSC1_007]
MKFILPILFVGLLVSCQKKIDPEIPAGALIKITAQGKLHQKLEYGNGKVFRLLAYNSCELPYSIVDFGYDDDKINFIRKGDRGLLSSWSGATCDPNLPFEYQNYSFERDKQGRVSKVIGKYSTVTYSYNGQKATVQVNRESGGPAWNIYLTFDGNGNIIERRDSETDTLGLTRFEYDNHTNPLRGLDSFGMPNPFTCPNNVLRSLDSRGQVQWERKFTYNNAGWPQSLSEGTGIEYQYHYQDN